MPALVIALMLQAAAPQRPPPSTADMPGWSKTPGAEEMTKAYPPEALAANLAGSATIECTVDAGGGLKDCVSLSETGPGFGAAALAVSGRFQMPTKAPSGAATAGRTVRFPIQWLNPAKAKLPAIVIYDDEGRVGNVGFNCRVRDDRSLDNCVLVDSRPRSPNLVAAAGPAALRAKASSGTRPGARVMVQVELRANR
ncbi:MAG: TonB family protein [Phenylobacterium sp.]|uniref:TonB family protein n=1 Tax=Phenylobacterium sp. TaxID=1871053 RepID=UPI001A47F8B7|nr:TonB family protein [Phenylobacterium sp.]MBL8771091.1 TonB family protein [Phenylobacterium sp.]